MGEIIAASLVSSGLRSPEDVAVSARREERVAELAGRYGFRAAASNRDAAAGAAAVVIAVKPQTVPVVLEEISGVLPPGCLVVSVAAGVTTASIESRLAAGVPVVRAMPNTPASVGAGITALCAGGSAGEEHLAAAEELLGGMGAVVRVKEDAMDAVTAVSGSGPAYLALVAGAMISAGTELGLSRAEAERLAVQTMLGTALLLQEPDMDPVKLREQVASPGGTTVAALAELEKAGVAEAVEAAVKAAARRAGELASGSGTGR